MARLQDMDGYPDKLNIREIITSDYPKEEIRDWAIDLLAKEAEPWLDYENEATSSFARAVIASCRPLMEAMAMNNGMDCDRKMLTIAIATHLILTQTLSEVKQRGIELGVREED